MGSSGGVVTLVLDPADGRTGVYWEGELIDVCGAGAWAQDVEAAVSEARPGVAPAIGTALADFLGGLDPAGIPHAVPSAVERRQVAGDWRERLSTGRPEDESMLVRFECEWVECLDDIADILVPSSRPDRG